MKRVIREGVFETNSSSTHSVVFKKKTVDKADKDSSYELHSPLAKTLFLIGLINKAEQYSYSYDDNDEAFLKQNLLFHKNLCEKFKTAVVEEYLRITNSTEEEFQKDFEESQFVCNGKCLCHYFFDDDVLNDCTCPFFGYIGIATELNLCALSSSEDFAKKASEFLSNDFKFCLQEFWNGFCLVENKDIF